VITYESDKLKQLIPILDAQSHKAFVIMLNKFAQEVKRNVVLMSPVGSGHWDVPAGYRERTPPRKKQGGELKKNWELHKETELRYVIDNPKTKYLKYVVGGTGIHGEGRGLITIVPKNKTVLRWFTKGGEIRFAKRVVSSGMVANPFMKNALEKSEERLDEFITMGFKESGLV
jgi:hypothetical protein